MTKKQTAHTTPDESRLSKYLINKCNRYAVKLQWFMSFCLTDGGAIFAALCLMEVL